MITVGITKTKTLRGPNFCKRNLFFAMVICSIFLFACSKSPSEKETRPLEKETPKPTVTFLEGKDAKEAIVDETLEPYFTMLQPLEIAATTGVLIKDETLMMVREKAREIYKSHVKSFSPEEREIINSLLNNIHPILLDNYPQIATIPWSFVKIGNDLCSGMAHTRGPHIVLSERHLQKIVDSQKEEDPKQALAKGVSVLLHEKIHVLQRTHPGTWGALYELKWNFVRANKIVTCDWLIDRQLTNPDAILSEWVMPLTSDDGQKRYIWPRTVFGKVTDVQNTIPKMPQDFTAVAIELKKIDHRSFVVVTDSNGVPQQKPLDTEPGHKSNFPPGLAWDHPHEIAAYALSKAIIQKHVLQVSNLAADKETANFFATVLAWAKDNLK